MPRKLLDPNATHKICIGCGIDKDHKEYYFNKSKSDGLSTRCKDCIKLTSKIYRMKNKEKIKEYIKEYRLNNPEWTKLQRNKARLLSTFNISLDDYNNQLIFQNNVCAICGGADSHKKLSIDHDHSCCNGKQSCGKCVRGLLCSTCNQGLGSLKDSIDILERAINYIKEPVWQH